MTAMRAASTSVRSICGALLALVLALRLLTPAGFMPSFEHGTVTIVACPDAARVPAMPHHHRDTGGQHQPCAYAAASAAAAPVEATLVAVLTAFATLLIASDYPFQLQLRPHDRPPPIGPPLAS